MASKIISLRVEQRLYEQFFDKLTKSGATLQNKITEWIKGYVSMEEDFTPTVKPAVYIPPLEEVVKLVEDETKLLRADIFKPKQSAQEFYSPNMDFAWMFTGEDLKIYVENVMKIGISPSGWYIKLWVWTYVWLWLTYAGLEEDISSIGILNAWEKGKSPVDIMVDKLTEKGRSDKMAEMLKDYYDDPDMFW